VDGLNTNLAYSKGWLCNRQGFSVEYYFRPGGIGDSIENPKGLTLQDYTKSHRIFAVCVFILLLDAPIVIDTM
jgi:hypothetical protein